MTLLAVMSSGTKSPSSSLGGEANGAGVLDFPVQATHAAMLPTGKVMIWQSWQTSSVLWDPTTGAFEDTAFPSYNIFCSSHTWLPDGRLFVVGGQRDLGSLWGEPYSDIYDPWTDKWASQDPTVPDVPAMNLGSLVPKRDNARQRATYLSLLDTLLQMGSQIILIRCRKSMSTRLIPGAT